jgi:glycosyltransferase involved in cell wall biosynthesis
VVGSCYDASYRRELKVQIHASGVEDKIVMLNYVPRAAFHTLMALTDVVVNLRSSDMLGLSAVLLRALAAAKPVITSDIEEWRIFPEGVCLSISKGDKEVEELTGHFIRLASDRPAMADLGRAARRWFLADGTLSAMADDYMAQMRCVEAFTKDQD